MSRIHPHQHQTSSLIHIPLNTDYLHLLNTYFHSAPMSTMFSSFTSDLSCLNVVTVTWLSIKNLNLPACLLTCPSLALRPVSPVPCLTWSTFQSGLYSLSLSLSLRIITHSCIQIRDSANTISIHPVCKTHLFIFNNRSCAHVLLE